MSYNYNKLVIENWRLNRNIIGMSVAFLSQSFTSDDDCQSLCHQASGIIFFSSQIRCFFIESKEADVKKRNKKWENSFYCGGTISLTLRFLMDTLFALSHLKVAVGPPHVMI